MPVFKLVLTREEQLQILALFHISMIYARAETLKKSMQESLEEVGTLLWKEENRPWVRTFRGDLEIQHAAEKKEDFPLLVELNVLGGKAEGGITEEIWALRKRLLARISEADS